MRKTLIFLQGKCISDGQRDKYRDQINDINLLEEYTIIDVDFKQKIVILNTFMLVKKYRKF